METKTPYQYLSNKFPEGEYILLQEVADSTARRRYLDFMAINLWESRGLAITGIEVKSYRGDWINELKNPSKQELHVPYCDYFYLFTTDEKVAKLEEIPDNWGWMSVKGGKVFTMKKAPKLNPIPIPKSFMISMLRRGADRSSYIHRDNMKDEIERLVNIRVDNKRVEKEREANRYKELYEKLKSDIDIFENQSGLKFPHTSWYDNDNVVNFAKAVNFVLNNNIENYFEKILRINQIAKSLSETSDKAITEYKG